jgi:biotin synthase
MGLARAGDGAGGAAAAAAAAAFFGAAVRTAAGGEGVGKFLDLGFGLIDLGQLIRDGIELRIGFAEEIEKERAAIEEMLDIDEDGGGTEVSEARGAGGKGLFAVFFEAGEEEVVFDGDTAKQIAVWSVCSAWLRGGQDFADFEAAGRAADDAAAAAVARAVGGEEAADAPEDTDADKMLACHVAGREVKIGRLRRQSSRQVHRDRLVWICQGNRALMQATDDWSGLAERVLEGEGCTTDEALGVLRSSDEELLEVLAAAYRVRRRWFGNTVQLYFLMNAKSGLCPEDCHYCSQSKVATSEIARYNLLSREKLLDGARVAAERGSKTYCIVISARGPSEREIQAVEKIVPEIKAKFDLDVCACLGLLTQEQAQRLAACGVDKVNHNLNTSAEFYEQICTTHTYQDRVETLKAVRSAGLALCSGGIVGMGEREQDVVQMAFALREHGVESIPVNFLIDIDGTPLERSLRHDQYVVGTAHPTSARLNPRYCLKVLAMFRLVNPMSELRIAGGREPHLRTLQPLGLYAANSIFVGDYLTTKGQPPEADYRMIEDMGFVITRREEVPAGHS